MWPHRLLLETRRRIRGGKQVAGSRRGGVRVAGRGRRVREWFAVAGSSGTVRHRPMAIIRAAGTTRRPQARRRRGRPTRLTVPACVSPPPRPAPRQSAIDAAAIPKWHGISFGSDSEEWRFLDLLFAPRWRARGGNEQ